MSALSIFPDIKQIPLVRKLFDVERLKDASPHSLPRKIYMYWDSGFDSAPEICRMCVESWKRLNPTWEVVLLDKAKALEIVPEDELPEGLLPNHFANLLRMKLMVRQGGVWADATLLCTQPLDEWLVSLFNQTDFFFFSRPGKDRLISNWFMASTPSSYVMHRIDEACDRYWDKRKRLPRNYFWHHALIQYLYLTSSRFRSDFRSLPMINANMCHILQQSLARGGPTSEEFARVRATPMQKLTHKKNMTPDRMAAFIEEIESVPS